MEHQTHQLIHRLGAAEMPAPGIWQLRRSSIVTIASRSNSDRLAVSGGTLVVVADAPLRSSLTIFAGSTSRQVRLSAAVDAISADVRGLSNWRFSGSLRDGSTSRPLHLSLSYNGTHRGSVNIWAWFTGSVTIGSGQRVVCRSRPNLAIEFDLMFDAPSFAVEIAENADGRLSRVV